MRRWSRVLTRPKDDPDVNLEFLNCSTPQIVFMRYMLLRLATESSMLDAKTVSGGNLGSMID